MAGVGPREIVILRGRGSVWCRSVVCGMSFCVAGAVFGTLLYTLHAPHFTCPTLYTLHFTLYTFAPVLSFIWCGSWNAFFGLDYEGLLFLHGHSIGCTTLLLPWQVHGLCSFSFSPTVSHSVFFFSRQMNVFG